MCCSLPARLQCFGVPCASHRTTVPLTSQLCWSEYLFKMLHAAFTALFTHCGHLTRATLKLALSVMSKIRDNPTSQSVLVWLFNRYGTTNSICCGGNPRSAFIWYRRSFLPPRSYCNDHFSFVNPPWIENSRNRRWTFFNASFRVRLSLKQDLCQAIKSRTNRSDRARVDGVVSFAATHQIITWTQTINHQLRVIWCNSL